MLNELAKVLGDGENLDLKVRRTPTGFSVLVVPIIKPLKKDDEDDEELGEDTPEARIRALLARPILVPVTGPDFDGAFIAQLNKGFLDARVDTLAAFEKLTGDFKKDAVAAAKDAEGKDGKKEKKAAGKSAPAPKAKATATPKAAATEAAKESPAPADATPAAAPSTDLFAEPGDA